MVSVAPLVSVVTVVLNGREFIADAIDSILAQTYPSIEYIVKDGGSTDGTLEILQEYRDRGVNIKVITGRDRGLYDAMNQGFRAATGEILTHLNADDFYTNRDSLAHVVRCMRETGADICWGDTKYVDHKNIKKMVRRWKSAPFTPGKFRHGWHPPHTGLTVRRGVYERHGWFDPSFRISGDYELMLRLLEKYRVHSCYIPEPVVTMRTGGVSGGLVSRLWRVRREDLRAWQMNGLRGGSLATLLKPLSKISQWLHGSNR